MTVRGKAAVVGVGESTYYKRGQSPDAEFVLALKAIRAACDDACIDVRDIDGFASYHNERSDPVRLAAALGIRELRYSNLQWGGGGGGGPGALANTAEAVAAGRADKVVLFRSLAQGQFSRYGSASPQAAVRGEAAFEAPYGLFSPAQRYAMRVRRFFHETGISPDTQRAVSLASYHHAQSNPRAIMYGKPLLAEEYDRSRWIVEPFHLYDCCMENDGAAAVVLVAAERAADHPKRPVFLAGAAQGSAYRNGAKAHNPPVYATAGFLTVAPRLYEAAGLTPAEIDVVQCYENFTGGVVMALMEHGFFTPENAAEVMTVENLTAPVGRLPLNTSGGNLAECYMHGLGLQVEAVRQIRGESTAQVDGAATALVIGGPLVNPVSSLIFCSAEVLS